MINYFKRRYKSDSDR